MAALEQEIIEKFHRLDKAAQRRVRALIERETEPVPAQNRVAWADFVQATYGSLADHPLDEVDRSELPPPVRDEVE
jgi:hypothetical protein